ncbi:MAG: hypothetical protein Q9217_006809 [Psora testacea]
MSAAVKIGACVISGRSVNITLATGGPGYKRLTESIQESIKETASDMVGDRVANGKVFKSEVLDKVKEIRIGNMKHQSLGDSSIHYSVEAWDDSSKLSDGHVPQDESKQTVAN